MFKKRTKRPDQTTARQRSAAQVEAEQEDGGEQEGGSLVSDLLALRKLKADSAAGIEAEKLNSGPSKRRKVDAGQNQAEPQQAAAEAGTSTTNNSGEGVARKNNFTAQQNLIDVDKHMMAYIESEMRKRTGQDETKEEERHVDPRDELYTIDDKYREKSGPLIEGNVTRSTAMLTAIPEVDLGIDVRLKNIEATERAKRSLYEAEQRAAQQNGPTRAQVEADNYARQRFSQADYRDGARRGGGDYERDAAALLAQARRTARARREMTEDQVLDAEAEAEAQAETRRKVNELKSTDELVMARYKSRQRDGNGRSSKAFVFHR